VQTDFRWAAKQVGTDMNERIAMKKMLPVALVAIVTIAVVSCAGMVTASAVQPQPYNVILIVPATATINQPFSFTVKVTDATGASVADAPVLIQRALPNMEYTTVVQGRTGSDGTLIVKDTVSVTGVVMYKGEELTTGANSVKAIYVQPTVPPTKPFTITLTVPQTAIVGQPIPITVKVTDAKGTPVVGDYIFVNRIVGNSVPVARGYTQQDGTFTTTDTVSTAVKVTYIASDQIGLVQATKTVDVKLPSQPNLPSWQQMWNNVWQLLTDAGAFMLHTQFW